MLDDIERRRLADIEAALSSEDPLLARRLGVTAPLSSRRRAAAMVAFAAAFAVAVWVGVLLAGAAASIAAALTVCAIAGGLLLQRRSRTKADPPAQA
ncbi:DUF3040 domain-containing protein [Actinoplanes sp. Pm04-4]|uniref:DUF3040 domain-containing protein n=1 Tax=Paractinoplanes pyxinae TaxID=2997416 RepID=A0ABT4BB36_9ACTN|nr:DUF3040 domain-containing protein [Actinoplanes pyxinae]MCY1143733.1 DUF3040 domain-containing protein [Actinoplanes pyxinae]